MEGVEGVDDGVDGGDWVDGGVVDEVEEDRERARVHVPIYSCQSTVCLVICLLFLFLRARGETSICP